MTTIRELDWPANEKPAATEFPNEPQDVASRMVQDDDWAAPSDAGLEVQVFNSADELLNWLPADNRIFFSPIPSANEKMVDLYLNSSGSFYGLSNDGNPIILAQINPETLKIKAAIIDQDVPIDLKDEGISLIWRVASKLPESESESESEID